MHRNGFGTLRNKVAGLLPVLTRAQKAKKMEQLEEQNRKLTAELSAMKDQMAQLLEMMRIRNEGGHSDDGFHHVDEEEERPPLHQEKTAVLIQAPEVSKKELSALEDRLRAMEGYNFEVKDAADLCLVKDIQFPPKFKVPDFPKYAGGTCPKSHLTMYCRKMAAHADNEKLLIHCFQDSLADSALNWYMQLDGGQVQTWRQLADAFLRRYKYNIDLTPDRSDLQAMSKGSGEPFKAYAQRWRELAAQVEPPLTEKETVSMFINSLTGPYYDKMIGNTSTLFADIVTIGERVEQGLKTGRIAQPSPSDASIKKFPPRKKEASVNAVNFATPSAPARSAKQPRKQERVFTPIPTSYGNLMPRLIEAKLLVCVPPRKVEPPYPDWYKLNEKCAYHSDAPGHSTESCWALKHKVQDLIDAGWLTFDAAASSVESKPLPQPE